MRYWWIELDNGRRVCADAETEEEALKPAHGIRPARVIGRLPYPAEPRLNPRPTSPGSGITCPSFCYTPNECAGKSCCPKQHRSCSS